MSDTLYNEILAIRVRMVAFREKHRKTIEATVQTVGTASGHQVRFPMMSAIDSAVQELDEAIDTYESENKLGEYAPAESDGYASYEQQHRQTMRDVL